MRLLIAMMKHETSTFSLVPCRRGSGTGRARCMARLR
jgi:microcystin degradation protein MlrC